MVNDTQVKKLNEDQTLTSIEIQLEWIDGSRSQIAWLNRPDILTDYVLELRIYRRRLACREKETGRR